MLKIINDHASILGSHVALYSVHNLRAAQVQPLKLMIKFQEVD